MDAVRPIPSAVTLPWLAVVLITPVVLSLPSFRLLGPPDLLETKLAGLCVLVLLFAATLAIIVRVERLPLSSIGWHPPDIMSLTLGLVLAAVISRGLAPLSFALVTRAGLGGMEAAASFLSLPLWYRALAAIVGPVFEEVAYRGFATERLASLTGSRVAGALIALTVFNLAHLPMWGWGVVMTLFLTNGLLTAFYLWRRDLAACIIAHVVVDMLGLVLV